MADTIKLDILTPLGPRREGLDVPGVEIPGIGGELGILPQHEAFVTAIVPGVVRFKEGAETKRIAVGSGFLEIKGAGRAVILVERALEPTDVDTEAVQARLRDVVAELATDGGSIDDPKRKLLEEERAWLDAQLRIQS